METKSATIEGHELSKTVVCLEQAEEQTNNETLSETISLAMENGYWLISVDDHSLFGTQYKLDKVMD